MKQYLKRLGSRIVVKLADCVAQEVGRTLSVSDEFADGIAHRVALETMLDSSALDKKPNELFSQISDGFWFWLCTEGYRKAPLVRKILPGMPDENTQLRFTGNKGDSILREGFFAYKFFRDT